MLASGGLDSSVLVADLAETSVVHPLYVRAGLAWEAEERAALKSFMDAFAHGNVRPIETLEVPARPLYGDHWSLSGVGVPGSDAPDAKVYLPGRNVLLISLAAVWCSTHDVHRIAIGSLGGNPFPDATLGFYRSFGDVLSLGLDHRIDVIAPYLGRHKDELIKGHADLHLEMTLTCMKPEGGVHCGDCNKCTERQEAFMAAGVKDRTLYAKAVEKRSV